MRFFATATASLVAMGVAGAVVKKGGVKLGFKAQQWAKGGGEYSDLAERGIRSFRSVQKYLDELEGVERTFVDPDNELTLFERIPDSRRLLGDRTRRYDGPNFRINDGDDPDLPPWTRRNQIQQRLVSQARRLPYELPGFYAADKLLIDPVLGDGSEKEVNWSNPVDVISDFAGETVKNLAFNVLPFEAGGAAASHAYRKTAMKLAQAPGVSPQVDTVRFMLEQVGANASDILNRTMKMSHQTIGSFSQLIQDASENSSGFTQFVRRLGAQPTHAQPTGGNSHYASRLFANGKRASRNEDLRRSALDSMPGPFKGMATAITKLKTNFAQHGQTYDDWQDVISGRKDIRNIKGAVAGSDPDRYNRLLSFLERGGGTHLQQYSTAMHSLNKGITPVNEHGLFNSEFRDTTFYSSRRDAEYKGVLVDHLAEKSGLTREQSVQFVNKMSRVGTLSSDKAQKLQFGEDLITRFQFTDKKFYGAGDESEWWDDLLGHATKQLNRTKKSSPIPTSFDLNNFQTAVTRADRQFSSSQFKRNMDRRIAKQWETTLDDVVAPRATSSLTAIRRPFEDFTGSNLGRHEDFLVRRAAQRAGINPYDDTGSPLDLGFVKSQLSDQGFDPANLRQLRGFLMDKKDIGKPWHRGGKNLFGFSPMSVGQAMNVGMFSAHNAGEQENIRRFLKYRTDVAGSDQLSAINSSQFNLKVGGVFTSSDGQVVDLGRIGRSVRGTIDAFASEYKLPVLNFNPLQIFGYNARLAQRRGPAVQVVSNLSNQRFVKDRSSDASGFLVWTRSKGIGGRKGKVFEVGGGSPIDVSSRELAGEYTSFITNSRSMVGRYGRLFSGDMGVPSSHQQDDTRMGRFKRLFNISHDQEGSLAFGTQSLLNRWRAARVRSDNPLGKRNPYRAAEAVASGRADDLFDENLAEGVDNLGTLMRNFGISAPALKEVLSDPRFAHAMDPAGTKDIFTLPENVIPRVVEGILESDNELFRALPSDKRRMARSLSQHLRNLLDQGNSQIDGWSMGTSDMAQGVGVGRRIDQLRNQLVGYLMTTSSFRSELRGGGSASVEGTISTLYAKLDELFQTGKISRSQLSESRAATLSMQFELSKNRAFQTIARRAAEGDPVTLTPYHINQQTISELLAQPHAKQVVGEVASFKPGSGGGVGGWFKSQVRRHSAAVPYTSPSEVNPIGADHLFVPTFGTVSARSGTRTALKGSVGGSWGGREGAFDDVSGATMVSTHMALRLNRYLETFGMGLDPTQFKGPLDFYARGLIGKRVAPLYIAGTTVLTADRMLGGMVNRDDEGNPVYSPFFLGVGADMLATGQVAAATLIPGGQTGSEKHEELMHGEVPIRQGRYWLLGNQPYKGGRIQYYRPSWYRRFKSGSSFAPEMNETPLERYLFGYDFSLLRPLDPYRREREDYFSRPYPVSGDYFTGPWGALNPLLNSTIGRVLKPRKQMHPEMNDYMLSQYAAVGDSGAFFSGAPSTLAAADQLSMINAAYASASPGTHSNATMYPAMGYSNTQGRASSEVRQRATDVATMYSNRSSDPGSYVTVNEMLAPYGVPTAPGMMTPRVIPSGELMDPGSGSIAARSFGYRTQEILGIYGFSAGSIRSALGLGAGDFTPDRAVLEPASRGYSSSRAFWNLNLGGTGDIPLPLESRYANLEVSEIIRRFVPKDPQGIQYVNDLPNTMGQMYPWLPGADYPLASVKTGDPYTSIPDAEIRLPGTGYARTHQLFSDEYGKIGLANIHDILGSIAPWSQEYQRIDSMVGSSNMSDIARAKVAQTRSQVENMRMKNEFSPYEYKYSSPLEMAKHPMDFAAGRAWEWLSHRDTFFNTKFLPVRTAPEDWERDNVYGSTFPQWQSPVESYVKPFLHKSTQRDPIHAISAGGGIGFLFGASPRAKALGAVSGGIIGGIASVFGKGYEAMTGDRYIPINRRKEVALEEYADILKYTKSIVSAKRAQQMGDMELAQRFMQESKQTMYGADLNATPQQLAMAVPSRKREHFRAQLYAPEQERGRILSTAGRLERRMYQAAWGMNVEARPELDEYFQDHELPSGDSEFWSPLVDMEQIKIKVGQSMGLDMAQMGYYPQQIQEANLVNPVYPDFYSGSSGRSVMAQLRELARGYGGYSNVSSTPNMLGGDRIELMLGVG